MALRFEHAFTVKAGPEKVWAYLTDPFRVAPALPGAAITEKTGDGSDTQWKGTITVKVGPVATRYKGTVRFEALDAAARTATIVAKGQDISGRGGADMKMESRLSEKAAGETEVAMVSEVSVTGVMAQFGRGLIQDVSNQMFQRFTEAARAELEKADGAGGGGTGEDGAGGASTSATATTTTSTSTSTSTNTNTNNSSEATAGAQGAPPIEVISFGTKILARAAGRTMRRPLFWIVILAVAGLVYWLSAR